MRRRVVLLWSALLLTVLTVLTGPPTAAGAAPASRGEPVGVRDPEPVQRIMPAPYRKRATRPFEMVAAVWTRGRPQVEVRTRRDGRWGRWLELHLLSGERATEALWVSESTGIQVRSRGRRSGLRLVLIASEARRQDRVAALTKVTDPPRLPGQGTVGWGVVPAPAMNTRKAWGADESWRDKDFKYINRLQQLHVHHTASVNGYTPADVPRLIRGMYAYHVKTLGWGDIGYNYLVDVFGRIWIGRAGNQDQLIRGAHTLGFNETGVGVSIIGNFEKRDVPQVALDAVARIGAWKFSTYGVDPMGLAQVKSQGSDLYRRGTVVTLPTVVGHRDTNQTDCPGDYVYADLAMIRTEIGQLITAASAARWDPATP